MKTKMKTILIINSLLLFFTFSSFSQEQKVTVKKDLVSVNDTQIFIRISTSYHAAHILYNLNNEKLAVINAQFYSDSKQITPGKPKSRNGYFDNTFLNDEIDKCEIRIVGAKK